MVGDEFAILPPAGQTPLFAIAGLPEKAGYGVANNLARMEDIPAALFKTHAFEPNPGRIYTNHNVTSLAKKVGEIVVKTEATASSQLAESNSPTPARDSKKGRKQRRRRKRRRSQERKPKPPTPTALPGGIYLLYLPSTDPYNTQELLSKFGFYSFPIPLPEDLRVDGFVESVDDYVERAVQVIKTIVVEVGRAERGVREVRQKILSRNTALLLPPRNFRTRDGTQVLHSFELAVTTGDLSAVDADLRDGSQPSYRKFTRDDLPNYRWSQGCPSRRFFIDGRDLVYPPDPKSKPDPREVYTSAPLSLLLHRLNELYRFGIPVERGYHYDVQRERGSALVSVEFHCAQASDGAVKVESVSASHANVYLNDYVRWKPA